MMEPVFSKSVTGMTPLQFQKQLRLQEARRLLLAFDLDAATVGYRVGYNSASHFSRDYRRLFGAPPLRDVERLRELLLTCLQKLASDSATNNLLIRSTSKDIERVAGIRPFGYLQGTDTGFHLIRPRR